MSKREPSVLLNDIRTSIEKFCVIPLDWMKAHFSLTKTTDAVYAI